MTRKRRRQGGRNTCRRKIIRRGRSRTIIRQETGEEAQPLGEQPGAMGGIQGTPQQPTELGPTGTGGGNIGIGNVPVAGEDTFSGTIGAAAAAGAGSPE